MNVNALPDRTKLQDCCQCVMFLPRVQTLLHLSLDGLFSGGAGCVGKWGLPVDHHPALRLPGRQQSGNILLLLLLLLLSYCFYSPPEQEIVVFFPATSISVFSEILLFNVPQGDFNRDISDVSSSNTQPYFIHFSTFKLGTFQSNNHSPVLFSSTCDFHRSPASPYIETAPPPHDGWWPARRWPAHSLLTAKHNMT